MGSSLTLLTGFSSVWKNWTPVIPKKGGILEYGRRDKDTHDARAAGLRYLQQNHQRGGHCRLQAGPAYQGGKRMGLMINDGHTLGWKSVDQDNWQNFRYLLQDFTFSICNFLRWRINQVFFIHFQGGKNTLLCKEKLASAWNVVERRRSILTLDVKRLGIDTLRSN